MSDPLLTRAESVWVRILWLVIIAVLMSMAQTVVTLLAILQLILTATNKSQPNVEIANFGNRLGLWLAKATRYLTGRDQAKPWPWSALD